MVGIVVTNDLNTCPYIDKYIEVLNDLNIAYEIIFWNRDGNTTKFLSNYVVYDIRAKLDVAKWKKIKGFYNYSKFLNDIIQKKRYDKLIFLTTFSALMCYKLCINRYKNKYIFDFRDLSFEKNIIFRKIVKKIIENSYFTCFSSPEFAKLFKINNYLMAHNFRYKDINKNRLITFKKNKKIINILHIGITRGEKYNKRIADIFGNDIRYKLYIIGRGNDTPSFLEYIKKYDNIIVKGTYDNNEKSELINNADILLYYYPCDFNCNRALANKYYDCLIYKKPLIGNINTYSGKRLQDKGLGISLDLDDNEVANNIFKYYMELDAIKFIDSINKELTTILAEDKNYLEKIGEFLNAKFK